MELKLQSEYEKAAQEVALLMEQLLEEYRGEALPPGQLRMLLDEQLKNKPLSEELARMREGQ